MLIGISKEIKDNENRVGIIPSTVKTLTQNGHHVLIETNAGVGSSISDADYVLAGATIVLTAKEAWAAELVVKVKEPIASEYYYLRPDLMLFTYLHLASNQPLTEALLQSKTTGIAYETVQTVSGALPLLTPMSEKEIAARQKILELEAQLIAAGAFESVNTMAIGEDEIAEMAKLNTVMQHFKQIAEKNYETIRT